jgi:hypothetical protein
MADMNSANGDDSVPPLYCDGFFAQGDDGLVHVELAPIHDLVELGPLPNVDGAKAWNRLEPFPACMAIPAISFGDVPAGAEGNWEDEDSKNE